MGALVLFSLFALLIMVSSVMVVKSRDPIVSAVFLVLNLFLIACLYAMLGADFIAAIQVLLYAGAIMVLFAFVIMLLNLEPAKARYSLSPFDFVTMLVSGLGFIVLLGLMFAGERISINDAQIDPQISNTHELGKLVFSEYVWPFELASILILLAVIASIVIAKKDAVEPKSEFLKKEPRQ